MEGCEPSFGGVGLCMYGWSPKMGHDPPSWDSNNLHVPHLSSPLGMRTQAGGADGRAQGVRVPPPCRRACPGGARTSAL